MFITQSQEKLIKSGINQRSKVANALPMNSLGQIEENESPNTAKCVSLLFFNLAKYKTKDLMDMYEAAPEVIKLSQQMMADKNRTAEYETKDSSDTVGHIANVLDCFWFRPLRETPWDAPGQRLANPDEQVEHYLNYDPKQVQPAIGLLVSPNVVKSSGERAYVIADGGNGTVLNTLPGLIQGWVNTFFDVNSGTLKSDATYSRSEAWVTEQLTHSPVFVEVYLDHIGDCPKMCDDIDSVERRVIEIFQKNNRGNKASIPNHINNIHMTKMDPKSYDRAIGDVLKNIMVRADVITNSPDDSLGGFSGEFEKLLSVMMNNGMNFAWVDACMYMASVVSKDRGEVSGLNDMDPMIWNCVFQNAVSHYGAIAPTIDFKSKEFQKLANEFRKIIKFYNKSGAFQGISGMADVNRELPEGTSYQKGKQFEIAARVLLELHHVSFGSESWNALFGTVGGTINKNKLRSYQVVDSNGQPYFHELKDFSFYTGDKSKSYFFKDGKKPIGSLTMISTLVNPAGIDKVKQDLEKAKKLAELQKQIAELENA